MYIGWGEVSDADKDIRKGKSGVITNSEGGLTVWWQIHKRLSKIQESKIKKIKDEGIIIGWKVLKEKRNYADNNNGTFPPSHKDYF